MKQLQVNLPDALAQQVLAAGLWESEALTDLLRDELQRRQTAQTFAKLKSMHQAKPARLRPKPT